MKIIYFFGNFCSLWSQSCLKHSTQWVNEVEWVSMVKVILWPWSKVTQISKLNVWIWACILRWAIQGLLGLLFHDASILVSVGVFLTHRFETVGVFAHFLCVKNAKTPSIWSSDEMRYYYLPKLPKLPRNTGTTMQLPERPRNMCVWLKIFASSVQFLW